MSLAPVNFGWRIIRESSAPMMDRRPRRPSRPRPSREHLILSSVPRQASRRVVGTRGDWRETAIGAAIAVGEISETRDAQTGQGILLVDWKWGSVEADAASCADVGASAFVRGRGEPTSLS